MIRQDSDTKTYLNKLITRHNSFNMLIYRLLSCDELLSVLITQQTVHLGCDELEMQLVTL